MFTSASGRCSGAIGAVCPWHAVVEQHHVVLNHPQPLRLGVAARSRWILLALERLALRDVREHAFQTGFLIVPEGEADRPIGFDVRRAEHSRQLHDQRCPRPVVIGRLSPAVAVHVSAHDIHLLGVGRADLRTVDLVARARRARLLIEGAQR